MTAETVRDLVIVGAGAAGMAAAATAHRGGLSPLLIDMYPTLGGHYYKQAATHAPKPSRRQQAFTQLERPLSEVDYWPHTTLWNVFQKNPDSPFTLYTERAGKTETLHTHRLLLCLGAYDRPLPFENWHLPGVMTLGGAQMLLKSQGLLPGKRVLVAGSGPLLVAVAAGLAEAGARVVAMLDTAGAMAGMAKGLNFLGQWQKAREAAAYMSTLARYRIPVKSRQTVFRVEGDQEVTQAVYGKLTQEGAPLWDSAQTVEVDAVCISDGFLPNIAVTKHLGCDHRYDPELAAHFPSHGSDMQTTRSGVYVAGDMTTIGGNTHAKLQGELAAAHILKDLGQPQPSHVYQQLEHKLAAEQRFLRFIHARMQPLPRLHELMTDQTYLCRCEMVLAGEVRTALKESQVDLKSMKLRTRVGMGACQGRYCETVVMRLLASAHGLDTVPLSHTRPPFVPVKAETLLTEAAQD